MVLCPELRTPSLVHTPMPVSSRSSPVPGSRTCRLALAKVTTSTERVIRDNSSGANNDDNGEEKKKEEKKKSRKKQQ